MIDIGYRVMVVLLWYVILPLWWCLVQLSRPCVFLWLILVFGCAVRPAVDPQRPSCWPDCGGEGQAIMQSLPWVWPG